MTYSRNHPASTHIRVATSSRMFARRTQSLSASSMREAESQVSAHSVRLEPETNPLGQRCPQTKPPSVFPHRWSAPQVSVPSAHSSTSAAVCARASAAKTAANAKKRTHTANRACATATRIFVMIRRCFIASLSFASSHVFLFCAPKKRIREACILCHKNALYELFYEFFSIL